MQTQKAMKEQTDRDRRIQMQQEREEAARFERLRKQQEYNGTLITQHQEKQLPVAFDLVLETEPNTNEIVMEVDLTLVQYMKQHQGKRNDVHPKYRVMQFHSSRRCSISLESSL